MTSDRPSRWIAPLALLAAVVAVLLVVTGSTKDEGNDREGGSTTSAQERREEGDGRTRTSEETETTARTTTQPERETYTVRPGDTLAVIGERTGVSVEELLELNPDIDPNSLTVGEEIKLTE